MTKRRHSLKNQTEEEGVRQAVGPFRLRDNNLTLSLSAVPSTEFTAALLIQAPSSFLCSAQSMFALLIITSDGPKSEKSFLSSIDKRIDNEEDCGLNTSLCTQMSKHMCFCSQFYYWESRMEMTSGIARLNHFDRWVEAFHSSNSNSEYKYALLFSVRNILYIGLTHTCVKQQWKLGGSE